MDQVEALIHCFGWIVTDCFHMPETVFEVEGKYMVDDFYFEVGKKKIGSFPSFKTFILLLIPSCYSSLLLDIVVRLRNFSKAGDRVASSQI